MKNVMILLLMAVFTTESYAQDKPVEEKKAVATWATGDAKSSAGGARNGLSLRDARKMGITVRSVAQSVKKLKDEGKITEDSTDAQVSALVAADLFGSNQAAWGDPATLDWQAILDFIEALLPIILKIISLF